MCHLELFHVSVFAAVILSWLAFAAAFLFRTRPPRTAAVRSTTQYLPGLILQAVGFAAVWNWRRQLLTHIVELPFAIEIALAVFTVVLAFVSAGFTISAIRVLGKQWAVFAQLVEDHALITTGPYSVVRHPIYTGLFGLLIATGLSMSTWQGLVLGVAFFAAGTVLRLRSEERLLAETFGETFQEYRKRVPSFLPFIG